MSGKGTARRAIRAAVIAAEYGLMAIRAAASETDDAYAPPLGKET